MIFSYTQISKYLQCPRSYRFRYLDGWQEREIRAGMIFGRCFEQALVALFCGQDPEVARKGTAGIVFFIREFT